MFSGIIEHKAKILDKKGGVFCVQNVFEEPLVIGQSIAHDGACMTLTKIYDTSYEFFVMEESLAMTNFSSKKIGDFFNVERSLQLGARIDGHIVTGHIDGVGKVIHKYYNQDSSCILTIGYPPEHSIYLMRKGSISLSGVSLTIVSCNENEFSVSLIPLTQEWTNLGDIDVEHTVNLEFDMFAKFAYHQNKKYLQNSPN